MKSTKLSAIQKTMNSSTPTTTRFQVRRRYQGSPGGSYGRRAGAGAGWPGGAAGAPVRRRPVGRTSLLRRPGGGSRSGLAAPGGCEAPGIAPAEQAVQKPRAGAVDAVFGLVRGHREAGGWRPSRGDSGGAGRSLPARSPIYCRSGHHSPPHEPQGDRRRPRRHQAARRRGRRATRGARPRAPARKMPSPPMRAPPRQPAVKQPSQNDSADHERDWDGLGVTHAAALRSPDSGLEITRRSLGGLRRRFLFAVMNALNSARFIVAVLPA